MKKLLFPLVCVAISVVMSLSASAASYNPSVEVKLAPSIATVIINGEERSAYITNDKGETTNIGSDRIKVSSVSESSEDTETGSTLLKAYNQIKSAASVADICSSLTDIVKSVFPGKTADDLVVRDLFNVSLIDENGNIQHDIDGKITISFSYTIGDSEYLFVMHQNAETGEWIAVDLADIDIDAENGTVSVSFSELCPVAFMTVAKDDEPAAAASNNVEVTDTADTTRTLLDILTSPQTSDIALTVAAAAAISAGCLICAVIKKKNKI